MLIQGQVPVFTLVQTQTFEVIHAYDHHLFLKLTDVANYQIILEALFAQISL